MKYAGRFLLILFLGTTHGLSGYTRLTSSNRVLVTLSKDETSMRKAWKKRRRSLSPQLIPVTLLTTKTGVLDDVLYLVEKHGRRTKQSGKLSSLPTMALPLGDV